MAAGGVGVGGVLEVVIVGVSQAAAAVVEPGQSHPELLPHLGREHTEQDGIHKPLPRVPYALRQRQTDRETDRQRDRESDYTCVYSV